jgi:crotonobetainyl-CoA:carnitine CoA-transferase CaiB-like acyl-CoA transferase
VAPFNGFPTSDGTIYIATSNDNRAHMCFDALGPGCAGMKGDPRFATNTARMANRAAMEERMAAVTRTRTTQEWEAVFVPAGVPASAINDVQALRSKHPEVFVRVDHPTAGSKDLSGAPFQFSASALDYSTHSPRLG